MRARTIILIFTLSLITSCSSGTTAEEEAKLIEYKSCLDAQLARFMAMGGSWVVEANENAQSLCARYKP